MTKPLNIEIESAREPALEVELFQTSSFTAGKTSTTLPDGSAVVYEGSLIRRAFGVPEILHLAADVTEGVGVGLFSSWLYDKLKGKPAKLRINRKEVEITADRIRIVIEEIEKEG